MKPIILDVECIVCNKTLQKIQHDPVEVSRRMGKITRRSRTPNWSLEEKQYLLELIKHRKEVVVTKTNNGPNHSEEKDTAWNQILRELENKFGSKFSNSTIKKVKTQWQNMKRIAREEIALNGSDIQKFSRPTLEVCNLLDLVKDGVLKRDANNLNETIATNIEIKTERIDEDMIEASCSNNYSSGQLDSNGLESSSSSISEPRLVINESVDNEEMDEVCHNEMKSVSVMTDATYSDEFSNLSMLHKQLQDFLNYTSDQKEIKMESLKEERQIARAIRETAELNKIIAEQKLKHLLWVKKREMA